MSNVIVVLVVVGSVVFHNGPCQGGETNDSQKLDHLPEHLASHEKGGLVTLPDVAPLDGDGASGGDRTREPLGPTLC